MCVSIACADASATDCNRLQQTATDCNRLAYLGWRELDVVSSTVGGRRVHVELVEVTHTPYSHASTYGFGCVGVRVYLNVCACV